MEAEQHVGSQHIDQVLDSVYVMESAMRHFFIRAESRKNTNWDQSEVDADYTKAAEIAAMVAPFRHAKLASMKLAAVDPMAIDGLEGMTSEQLREKVMEQLRLAVSQGVIDLKDLAVPEGGMANQHISAVDQFGINGKRSSELCRSVPRSAVRCVK
jgi:hypothetical protein